MDRGFLAPRATSATISACLVEGQLPAARSRYRPAQRLQRKRDFDAVFHKPAVRVGGPTLWLVARPNDAGLARLGMVVAKRFLKRAVARNRAKRMIRESFRRSTDLPAMDIVVRVVQKDAWVSAADADRLFTALVARTNRPWAGA